MVKLMDWFGGRFTFFGLLIVVSGTALAMLGKLTGEVITFYGIVQTLVLGRTISGDVTKSKSGPVSNSATDSDR